MKNQKWKASMQNYYVHQKLNVVQVALATVNVFVCVFANVSDIDRKNKTRRISSLIRSIVYG